MRKRYILVCEKGWRGIRELSLDLAGKGIPSTVLIKGAASKDVQNMITGRKEIKNVFIPERIFALVLFTRIIGALILSPRRKAAIFLSKEKTYKRLEALKRVFPEIELAKVFD